MFLIYLYIKAEAIPDGVDIKSMANYKMRFGLVVDFFFLAGGVSNIKMHPSLLGLMLSNKSFFAGSRKEKINQGPFE